MASTQVLRWRGLGEDRARSGDLGKMRVGGPGHAKYLEVQGIVRIVGDEDELIRLAARFLRHAAAKRDAVPGEVTDLLRAGGLGHRHMSVLIGLAVHGAQTVGVLAERIALAPATTSQLVNELRRAGLVTRTTDPDDRRRAVIAIDDELRPRITAIAADRARPLRNTLARLDPEDRAAFLRGWRVLIEEHDRQTKEKP